jgi:hypothetical protein
MQNETQGGQSREEEVDPTSEPMPSNAAGSEGVAPSGHGQVEVVVYAPNQPDPKPFKFAIGELVGAAAQQAAAAFGYAVGNPSFQVADGGVLDRTVTLQVAGVHNGQKLELVDAGGGV